ncbi:MAG: hypothetical protein P8J69_01645 [Flavobacteriaceae bacterium]|nr:hypothetical protein [Flavobacteriaceae bacterium]
MKLLKIENYEEYYQYFTKDTSFKASESFYNSYKEFNFANNYDYENSSAYNNLLESHCTRMVKNVSSNNNKYITLAYL